MSNVAQIIDRVRLQLGDINKVVIPDDTRLRAIAAISFQDVYKDIGVAFNDVISGTLSTTGDGELILPKEFVRAKIVLVNGIEVDEMPYENVVSGRNLGINVSSPYNGVAQNLGVQKFVYYFRNGINGRYLGISPLVGSYYVWCLYEYIPEKQNMVGNQYSELISPFYEKLLILRVALDALPLMESYEAAQAEVSRQSDDIAKIKEVAVEALVNLRVQTPLQIQSELIKRGSLKRMELKNEYQKELEFVRRTIQPMVKFENFRNRNWLLNRNFGRAIN